MISKKQREVLDFIQSHSKSRGYAPSLKEVCKHFKLSSASTAHFHIAKLKKAGYLEKLANRARAIKVPKKEQLVKITLAGEIAAGEPIEAIRQNEYIVIAKQRLPKTGNLYALRVKGNSMVGENIKDGDVVLAKKQSTAENGQRVVALIDNSEVTLKKFYREKNRIRLQPANTAYEPTILQKGRDIKIQGIVIDVIQNEPQQIESLLTISSPKRNKMLPLNEIILGDALAELKKIPNESCDVIIADPPYNIGKNFGNNSDKREMDDYVSWCKEWINECIRAMKPNGTMFIYGFSEILAHLSVEIPLSKRWLIWHYTNKNMASCNFWQRSHEAIICAWKEKPIFNMDSVREPYTEGFLNGAAGKIRTGKSLGRLSRKGIDTIYNAHPNGALPRDVIKIPALAGGAGMNERWFLCKTCDEVYGPRELKQHQKHETIKHPTQKPLELSRRLILSAAPKKNGVILAPFAGTGSECVSAKGLGQSYVGFEVNPDYIRIAEKFLNSVKFIPKLL